VVMDGIGGGGQPDATDLRSGYADLSTSPGRRVAS
jgi:hypothetical protein